MATQGPSNPAVASGTGWTTPSNVEGSSGFAGLLCPDGTTTTSNPLIGEDFGFSIPVGATINGITAVLARNVSSTSSFVCRTLQIQLLKSGIPDGTPKGPSASWGTSTSDETWGNGGDLWGTTWTPAQINASNLGVQMLVEGVNTGGLTRTAHVQNYRLTITYTSAAGVSKAVCSQVVGW